MTAVSANAQLLPGAPSDGVIEINLDAISFATSDIRTVEKFELDGLHNVQISLAPRFDAAMGALTKDKIGRELWVTHCGRRIISARVQEEMANATFVITTGDLMEATEIAAFFQAPPCGPQS